MQPTAVFLAAAGLAAATTIPVSVGRNGLTFEPNVIRAHEGDVIEFRFWPRNHSVVAGDFTQACRPATDNGFFSGFFPTQPDTVNAEVFRVTVTHTNPVPLYCSQNTGQHCKNGMVAVINPADVGRLTLKAYADLACAAGNATSPSGGAFGGVVAPNPGASGSGSSSASASASASVASSSGGSSAVSSTAEGSETQTRTESTAGSEATATAGTTTTAATTTGGEDATVTTATTDAPTGTGTGNVAAGVAVPVAGLVAVAIGAFFI
ncbi:hypothetical protein B0I37DRAFT_366679 [Chaetomium sp. MPI-CAGE-AT-0009]|nr:hypothetical protein B0I37DRAFT_366679 [Chaetomium sp. MPI-CAGE-AT-0009]